MRSRLLLLFGILTTTLLYLQGLKGGFVNDDRTYFIDNDLLPNLSPFNLGAIFFSPSNYWGEHLPLRDFLYVLQYAAFGNRPLGYHVVSLLLYLLLICLVLKLSEAFAGHNDSGVASHSGFVLPLSVTALFAALPTHVESVAYVSGQKDLLCAIFSLTALLAAFRICEKKAWNLREVGLFIGAYYAAFFSKNLAVANIILVPLLLAIRFGPRSILSWKNGCGWLLFNIPAIAWLVYSFELAERYFGETSQLTVVSLGNRMVGAIEILGAHLRLVWNPFGLSFGYPFEPGDMINLLAGAIILGVAMAVAIRAPRSLECLGLVLFLSYMLPVLQLFSPLNNATVYDRYLLLPSLGLCLLTVAILQRKLPSRATLLVILALIVIFSVAKYQYILTYASDVDVARNSYEKFPAWRSASFNLAESLIEMEQLQEVEYLLGAEPALTFPEWVIPYLSGRVALRRSEWGKAVNLLQKAMVLCQKGGYFPFPGTYLGEALIATGDVAQARFWLKKVVESKIYNPLEYYRATRMLRELS